MHIRNIYYFSLSLYRLIIINYFRVKALFVGKRNKPLQINTRA